MDWLVFKCLTTSGLVVIVSKIAKYGEQLGTIIAFLPLITVIVLKWVFVENQPTVRISNHVLCTF